MATTTLPETTFREANSKPSTGTKYVYAFGGGKADGNGKMKEVLGGKGAGLAEMTNAGLPVPPGFTIQTEACREYMRQNSVSSSVDRQMDAALAQLEALQGQKLGKGSNPLLVSVRSGAKFSMPGMMDTILNLGLNDESVEALAKLSNNPRFAYDSYRRLIQMFGNVVLDIEKSEFDEVFDAKKKQRKAKLDTDLDAKALKEVIEEYKKVVKKHTRQDFPQDPRHQLVMARDAVFRSWNNERAKHYRRINNIDDMLGTAVNVQAMVYGNLGDTSGTGVGFTRNPAIGTKEFYGEFLMNAQGEDVVSGVRTPVPILELEKVMPDVYNQLRDITTRLEKHYRDMQDFEFTIQDGKLYMLQTRNGKRTGLAAVRVAPGADNDQASASHWHAARRGGESAHVRHRHHRQGLEPGEAQGQERLGTLLPGREVRPLPAAASGLRQTDRCAQGLEHRDALDQHRQHRGYQVSQEQPGRC